VCNPDGSGEVTLEIKKEVVEYAVSKGVEVLGSWSMPGKIGLILQTASQAQMFTISPIRIRSLSRQVYAKLWNQVEIHYAFELLIPVSYTSTTLLCLASTRGGLSIRDGIWMLAQLPCWI
jgi:hypothetical protein